MSEEEQASNQVRGERDAHTLTRAMSVQSRVSNLLAIGLMSVLGLGSLSWYYANAFMRQGHAKQSAAAAATSRAQGDVPLPSLGRIDPPKSPLFDPLSPSQEPPQDQPPLGARTLAEIPLTPNPPNPPTAANPAAQPKTPAQLALERELSGAVFSPQNAAATAATNSAGAANGQANVTVDGIPDVTASGTANRTANGTPMSASSGDARPEGGELAALLRPAVIAAVRARVLPAQRLLLPKGAFIDCTLETAIDSTLPGMTTCVMATDAFGVDGSVVLLERGTKLIGETRGQVQQGAARIFVLWTEARTPTGVIVPLDSPGTDELGRSGLPGAVDRHFWERFGAAMLVSVIDGAVQAAAHSSHGGSGNVVISPSTSQDVLTEILKNTINIPPTVVKQNGDRIQVLVARDLDFRSVYELRSASGR